MSADTLRRAAALMRERAESASPSPWRSGHSVYRTIYSEDNLRGVMDRRWDGEYVASWHPAVALAVADWLDKEAEGIAAGNWRPCASPALAVARAYLNEPTP